MTLRGTFAWLSMRCLVFWLLPSFGATLSLREVRAIAGISKSTGVETFDVAKSGRLQGCIECGDYRCPENPGKCLLGSVPDSCGCCAGGLCARLEGEPCWNSSIPQLLSKSRNEGFCARNYLCQLRADLQEGDEPEAVCVCKEQRSACGSNNETYDSSCALHEEAMRLKNSSILGLQHLGPCNSRPWIVSLLEHMVRPTGQHVAINCEAKGFPVPDIYWEFHVNDGRRVMRLPDEEHPATVHTSEGPEPLMRTSWMQLPRLSKEVVGTYQCIANNSVGQASAASFLSMI